MTGRGAGGGGEETFAAIAEFMCPAVTIRRSHMPATKFT